MTTPKSVHSTSWLGQWMVSCVSGLLFLKKLFIFGCAISSLRCGLFSSCGEQRLLSSCGLQAPHCGGFSFMEHSLRYSGFSSCGPGGLGSCGSWALGDRLSSCGTAA